MLQSQLAVRFMLAIHRENKERPVYVLVVGKNGQKLQPAEDAEGPLPNTPDAADYIRPAAKRPLMPRDMWPSPAEHSVRCAAVDDLPEA
jgi:uncharacterized protein (TIGR03435 family)